MIADPRQIMRAETGAGDDIEFFLGEPRHGQVGLDAAARVEKLRVGQPASRLADVVGADQVQRFQCVGSAQFVFGER